MAIDSRIALGAQAPDTNTAIRGGLLNADTFQKIQENKKNAPLRNKLLEAQVGAAEAGAGKSQAEANRLNLENQAQSVISGIDGVTKFLDNDDFEGASAFLDDRANEIEGREGDPQHTQAFKATLAAGPQEGETPEQFKARIKSDLDAEKQAIYDSGLVERPKVDDITKKRLEESRAAITNSYKSVDTGIGFIKDSKQAMSDLAKEIKKGNRNAVATFFVKLVKTGDPNSAVLASEMLGAMNLEDLAEAAFKVSQGSGDVNALEGALQNQLSGSAPENINLKDALNVADASLNSTSNSLLDTFDISQERLQRLTEGGKADLTSEIRNKNVDELRSGGQPMWYQFIPKENVSINLPNGQKAMTNLAITPEAIQKRMEKRGENEQQARAALEQTAANYLGWGSK